MDGHIEPPALGHAWALMREREAMQRAHHKRMSAASGPSISSLEEIKIQGEMQDRWLQQMMRLAEVREVEVAQARAEGKSEADIQAIVERWKPRFPEPPKF